MAAGINGSAQVVKPIQTGIFVKAQNTKIPQRRFNEVPAIMPAGYAPLKRVRSSVPRPMIYAISGKDKINPPVGPKKDCHPPVKFAKTGNPIAPSSIYIIVEKAPFLEPSTILAKVMAKVCMVIGTPKGIGMEICAMMTMTAVHKPIMQSSRIFNFDFFMIKSPV